MFQSRRLVGRVAELGSLGRITRMKLRRPLRIHRGAWLVISVLLFAAGLCIRFDGKWDGITIGSLWVLPFQNPHPWVWVVGLCIAALYSAVVLAVAVFTGWILQYFVGFAFAAF